MICLKKVDMKKLLLILIVMMIGVSTLANEYSNLNPRFDEKSNAMILDRNAPCNQGEEPFCEFLFKTYDRDSAFIKERFKLDKAFYGGNNPPEPYLEPYLPLGLTIVKSEKVLFFTEEEPFWQEMASSWFDVTADRVCYVYGELFEDGQITMGVLYIFKRIEGKWYFVAHTAI